MTKTLKVGVIGVGGIARSHMPGWKASEHAEVVAGSDLFEGALKHWGAVNDVKQLSTNAADIINDPDIDIIDVCTPNMYHTELVVAALNAGKHVICEKPLAPTPEGIHQMIAARDKSGKLLMTAQHFRFQGASQAMKREIDGGALGDIYHARSWMIRRGWLPVRPGFIYKKNSGGGPCIDVGVHILDLTLWFMGNPKPIAVSGVAKAPLAKHAGAFSVWANATVPDDMDVEDFAAAFVRFDNGATLILEVSWLMHHKTEGEDMQFQGIPSFSPEIFKELLNMDPMKSKQLDKGIEQLTDEGVAQLFTLQPGNRKIVGTVGDLQFDVIQYRLEHEYGAKCRWVPLNYTKACWITAENPEKLSEFIRLKGNQIAYDKDKNPVFMAESDWILRMNRDNNPDIQFHLTSEFKVAEA